MTTIWSVSRYRSRTITAGLSYERAGLTAVEDEVVSGHETLVEHEGDGAPDVARLAEARQRHVGSDVVVDGGGIAPVLGVPCATLEHDVPGRDGVDANLSRSQQQRQRLHVVQEG